MLVHNMSIVIKLTLLLLPSTSYYNQCFYTLVIILKKIMKSINRNIIIHTLCYFEEYFTLTSSNKQLNRNEVDISRYYYNYFNSHHCYW